MVRDKNECLSKSRAISLDIRLQKLNISMFKISSRNCIFTQWHHTRN